MMTVVYNNVTCISGTKCFEIDKLNRSVLNMDKWYFTWQRGSYILSVSAYWATRSGLYLDQIRRKQKPGSVGVPDSARLLSIHYTVQYRLILTRQRNIY